MTITMKLYNIFIKYKNITHLYYKIRKNTSCLIYFLLSIMILAYIIPTIIFQSPSGTDVYTHMYNTLRMTNSNSLFEFYEKSFKEESLQYDYPFGLWFFGSVVMKVTGMSVHMLVYVLTLILCMASVIVYYIYAHLLLGSKNKAILATIFLISMPNISIVMLNYSPSIFILVLLIAMIYTAINKFNLSNAFIIGLMVFFLTFTHTGTYMFLMFFSISYFIISALIWKRLESGMYVLVVSLLFFYVISVQLFPYVQPQYIDKGRMVISISESISSKLGLEIIKDMGKIFYDKIFVANNFIYVIFWSSFIYTLGRFLLHIHSKLESYQKSFLSIPIIGNLKNVSHSITAAPFWLGPIHTLLSVFGIFKLDAKGKCIALSLALTSFFPGALQGGEGTGSLRVIYYLFLIIPISSAAGFYYIISIINKYSDNKIKKLLSFMLLIILLFPLISAPIVGSLYYKPKISGTKSEKENLIWLSKVGNPNEGVPAFAYRERIDLYANKSTPDIPSGSEAKRFLNDLKNTYFSSGAEEFTRDLHSFNIQYIISSDRILKGYRTSRNFLTIDANKQLDKIYSSDNNFGIYRYIPPPVTSKNSTSQDFGLKFKDASPEIQDFGSIYLVENEFYKVKLDKTTPKIKYIGTPTKNLLGEGSFYEYISISWRTGNDAYKKRYAGYILNKLKYPEISVKDNQVTYRTVVRDSNNTENWATLIVKYTFYEKAIRREIIIANDWVNLNSDLSMNLGFGSSIFAPINSFDFTQIGYGKEKRINRKIYPSQDAVILKDKKFNQIYLNESTTGLLIRYGDLAPYPSKVYYQGSTIHEYGGITISSKYTLSPSESIDIVQYFSVGDKSTAKNNIQYYTSVKPYPFPEAKIPIILTGYLDKYDYSGYSSNTYKEFQNHSVVYNMGITATTKFLIPEQVNPIGYATLYEKWTYKNLSLQNEEIKRLKALNVSGMLFKSFKYNMNTIKILSDSNLIFAEALRVPSPFMEFFREGLRNPKLAYYHGNKTEVVLISVTSPSSYILNPIYDVERVFSQWKETMNSVVEDGGMAVFLWNARDIGNPDYIDRIMGLINYSRSKGMNFTTPDEIAEHFRLIQKISANVTKGVDYVIINAKNHNNKEVKGVTYELELPLLNNSCPYHATNARIPRHEMIEGRCRVYVSFDLKPEEQKEVSVKPKITKKQFELDFSELYEGESIIKVKDKEGNPVPKADVYVDAKRFVSDYKGEVKLTIRRGMHRISVQKPGFVSGDYEIEVKGRVYKLLRFIYQAS